MRSQSRRPQSSTRGWEPPTPLELIATPPVFPTDVLPEDLRAYVWAEAEAVQVPIDLPAMVCLAALATVAGGRVLVEPADGWREGTNLFIAIAMDPGERKSAVFRDTTEPIRDYEREVVDEMAPEIVHARTAQDIAAARLKRLQDLAAKAPPADRLAADEAAQEAAAELAAIVVPAEPALFTTDVTNEKLASLLAAHDGRFAVLSAEGGTFDRIGGLYSGGTPNLDIYLGGHAGDPIKVDRQGRPSERIDRPALTLGLTVQPASLVAVRANRALRGRGLLDRFLFSVPLGRIGTRLIEPTPMPERIRSRYGYVVETLARSLDQLDQPLILTLDRDAAERFRAFRAALEPRRGPGGDLATISGWASKLDGAVARIAALLYLAIRLEDGFGGPIGEQAMAAAVAIGGYLIQHALIAFDAMGADEHRADAQAILDWTQRDGLHHFGRRAAQRALHRRFPRVADIEPALQLLVEHGFIRPLDRAPHPGSPAMIYAIYRSHPPVSGDNGAS